MKAVTRACRVMELNRAARRLERAELKKGTPRQAGTLIKAIISMPHIWINMAGKLTRALKACLILTFSIWTISSNNNGNIRWSICKLLPKLLEVSTRMDPKAGSITRNIWIRTIGSFMHSNLWHLELLRWVNWVLTHIHKHLMVERNSQGRIDLLLQGLHRAPNKLREEQVLRSNTSKSLWLLTSINRIHLRPKKTDLIKPMQFLLYQHSLCKSCSLNLSSQRYVGYARSLKPLWNVSVNAQDSFIKSVLNRWLWRLCTQTTQ